MPCHMVDIGLETGQRKKTDEKSKNLVGWLFISDQYLRMHRLNEMSISRALLTGVSLIVRSGSSVPRAAPNKCVRQV